MCITVKTLLYNKDKMTLKDQEIKEEKYNQYNIYKTINNRIKRTYLVFLPFFILGMKKV